MSVPRDYKQALEQLLAMRKQYPYRLGLLQGFVICGKITQDEWERLYRQVVAKVKEPKL
jgi:hypothetical protein